MPVASLTIDARRLWPGEDTPDQALAFIDLAATHEWPDELALPPCPVIGIGSRDHPLGGFLDCVIEPPISAEGLSRSILARPVAAATAVQLLRAIAGMAAQAALIAESLAYGVLQGSAEHLAWRAAHPPGAASAPGSIETTHRGGVLEIRLNRPEQGNAIDVPMRDALRSIFAAAALDPARPGIVLRGAGRTFSLGADLSEFGTTRDPAKAHAIRMATLPAPMIAACADRLEARIQGGCVGAGLEMAAWAARIVAQADAWFHLPELAMGVLPGAGGCVSLSRRIGRQRTALMLLSGRRITARTALEWGLVDVLVDDLAACESGSHIA